MGTFMKISLQESPSLEAVLVCFFPTDGEVWLWDKSQSTQLFEKVAIQFCYSSPPPIKLTSWLVLGCQKNIFFPTTLLVSACAPLMRSTSDQRGILPEFMIMKGTFSPLCFFTLQFKCVFLSAPICLVHRAAKWMSKELVCLHGPVFCAQLAYGNQVTTFISKENRPNRMWMLDLYSPKIKCVKMWIHS